MGDDRAGHRYADRCLNAVEALVPAAGLGRLSTILVEFEGATMAIIRDEGGYGRLVIGASSAGPAQVLLEARRRSVQPAARVPSMSDDAQRSTPAAPPRGAADGGPAVPDLEVAEVRLESSGQAVTARVELMHGERRIVATSTGRNAEERHLYLMAEAAARAVTQFLPPGYGVILGEIQPLPGASGDHLKAAVLFLTPSEDQPLEGTVRIEGSREAAAARTVLAAVHERVRPLLTCAAPTLPSGS